MPEAEAGPLLFLVMLGGRVEGGLIEVHDARLVAGVSLEATFPSLRRGWFGRPRGLHLDSWAQVRGVDGHGISLRSQPPAQASGRLWFVNLGAYEPTAFHEMHGCGLVVAPTAQAARGRALRLLPLAGGQRHHDDLAAVDDCLAVDRVDRWHVHLRPDPAFTAGPLAPDWIGYRRIDRS
jgi:Domain of Unknown Function (DUF1543)